MTSPLEYRITRFQDLVSHGKYYRIMNWNLGLILRCFHNERHRFKKPNQWDIAQHEENFCFY